MKDVIVLIGDGSIGQAVVHRVGAGKHILLGALRKENAEAAARTLDDAGFAVSTATVDVSCVGLRWRNANVRGRRTVASQITPRPWINAKLTPPSSRRPRRSSRGPRRD